VSETVFVNIVVEDVLSEVLLKKIIENSPGNLKVNRCFRKGGSGYIKKNLQGFNHGAGINPFIVLVDLDKIECPPSLIKKWITFEVNDGFIFRVAVREIESWIMADKVSFADYISVSSDKIPHDIETIEDPKEFLLNLLKGSKKKDLKDDMLPRKGSTSKLGPLYNDILIDFISNHWELKRAVKNSRSLEKLVKSLKQF
jgi:hypothetical protein